MVEFTSKIVASVPPRHEAAISVSPSGRLGPAALAGAAMARSAIERPVTRGRCAGRSCHPFGRTETFHTIQHPLRLLRQSARGPVNGTALEPVRRFGEGQRTCRHRDDQIVRHRREHRDDVVERVEHVGREPTQTLAAVDERMVAGEGLEEHSRLLMDAGVGVAPYRLVGASPRHPEGQISHRRNAEISGEGEEVFEGSPPPLCETVEQCGVPLTAERDNRSRARCARDGRRPPMARWSPPVADSLNFSESEGAFLSSVSLRVIAMKEMVSLWYQLLN